MKNINLLWLLLLIPSVLVQTYVYPVTLAILATAYLASKYLKVEQQEQPTLDHLFGDRIEDLASEQEAIKSEIRAISDKVGRVNLAISQKHGPIQR